MTTFFTIAQIKAANKAAGKTFFAPKEMRLFHSRIHRRVYGGHFFVMSERRETWLPCDYVVCRVADSGDTLPVARFSDRRAAHREAARLGREYNADNA